MLKNKNKILKRFTRYYILYIVAISILCFITYKLIDKNIHKNLISREQNKIAEYNFFVEEIMSQLRSDVNFLTSQTQLFNTKDDHEFKRHLKEIYEEFSRSKHIFDQIRFIDSSGMEKTRINFDGNGSYIVPELYLQNKKNRYYFKEIIKLKRSEIYFSPFDLNIENGEIETPYKPTIRIGMPVFNTSNEKTGIVVVNYLGDRLLNKLKQIEKNKSTKLMLTNANGYYLKGLFPELEWGFMFEEKKTATIFNDFNDAAIKIYQNNKDCFYTKNGLFCFKTIYPTQWNKNITPLNKQNPFTDRRWKLISFYSTELIQNEVWGIYKSWLLLFISSLIPMSILLWFLSKNIELKRFANQEIILKNLSLENKNIQIKSNLDELKNLNISLDKSNTKLEESIATKDKFFSIIAHDLKNPLSANVEILKILQKDFQQMDSDKQKKMINLLTKSSTNVYVLLTNLLEWANSQRGLLIQEPIYININSLIASIIAIQQESANNKNIDIIFDDTKPAHVLADKNMISTVINNLISNAIKFTHENGKIEIRTINKINHIQFSIKDNGVGMSQDKVNKLFKIEHSISSQGTNKEIGTGLGLLLCKEFINKNKGEIWFESELNKGTVAYFTLPISQ